MRHIEWSLSDDYRSRWQFLGEGLGSYLDVKVEQLRPRVRLAQQEAMSSIETGADAIRESISRYSEFFRFFGFECPLVRQFEKVRMKGFPQIDPFVDISLLCEMRFGVLMGIHDLAPMDGQLVFDCLTSAEGFEGMRTPVLCRAGEMVVRDRLGIVASYFQGADKRTCIGPSTSSVVVFAFGAPGVGRQRVVDALDIASELLKPVSSSSESAISKAA